MKIDAATQTPQPRSEASLIREGAAVGAAGTVLGIIGGTLALVHQYPVINPAPDVMGTYIIGGAILGAIVAAELDVCIHKYLAKKDPSTAPALTPRNVVQIAKK